MTQCENAVTCHWLTPTRILPHPLCFEAGTRPWSCLRDARPRAVLTTSALLRRLAVLRHLGAIEGAPETQRTSSIVEIDPGCVKTCLGKSR